MAKMSNKQIIDALEDLNYNASSFDPEEKNYDPVFYEDKEFFKYALRVESGIMEYAPEHFKSDKEIAEMAVLFDINNLEYVSDEIRADKEFMKTVVAAEPYALRYLDKELLLDKNFLNGFRDDFVAGLLESGPEELKNDRDFVLKYIGWDASSIKYLSDEFKNDREIALKAAKSNGYVMSYVSDELKKDRDFVLEVVRIDGTAIEHIAEELLSDREIALAAVSKYGGAMKYIDKKFYSDKDIILAGILSRFNVDDVYENIPSEIRSDREFMKYLLFLDKSCFNYLDDSLKKDPEFKLIYKLHDI